MALDLALVVFDHTGGAESAFADARDVAGDAPWTHEVSFVEHHKRGRLVVRGTFAGRFLDTEDEADPLGKDVAVGALTGAVVGAAFGPPGFAAGLVTGGAVGGLVQGSEVEELRGGFFDEVRGDVPQEHSALVLLAAPGHVDAMLEALQGAGRPTRRTLSDAAVAKLAASVSGAPEAAPPPAPPASA